MVAGAVALLLVVACANVSHLSLARATSRERELAVRFALGAGRARLVRQLLTESLMLSVAGGALAAALGAGALALLRGLHPPTLAALGTVAVDRSVFAIAAVLTAVAGVAIGLLVGLKAAHVGVTDSLRIGAGGRRASTRFRSVLVVSEIALSSTLLVGALVLVRGVIDLQSSTSGVDTRGLYAMTVPLRGSAAESGAGKMALARRIRERVRALPGVVGLTIAEAAPFKTPFYFGAFETPDRPGDPNNPVTSTTNTVSPDYFSVLGVSMLAGHTFDAGSTDRNEVVVDEVLAKQLWPNESAIGKRFRIASGGPGDPARQWWTVIGVTRNVLAHGLLDGERSPGIYSPLGPSFERGRLTVIARWKDGSTPSASFGHLGAELSPVGPPPTLTNLAQYLSDSIAEPRFAMQVLASFAALAVVLAAIGLYGVIAYSVTQRTREIGIRMTLGATRRVIAHLVIGNGFRLSCIGIALGLGGATVATRAIAAALYGVGKADVLSFVVGAVGLLMVSLLACVVPVVRATAVDPTVAVRAD
jgi:predicted permease